MTNPTHKPASFPDRPVEGAPIPLPFSPRSLLLLCLFIQAWLVFLHMRLADHENPGVTVLGQAFDVTRESSVPTSWAFLQAVGVAVTAAWVAILLRVQGVTLGRRIGWIGAAFLFGAIAIDDAAALHERFGSITSLDLMRDLGYPSYPWHVTVAPFLGLGLLTILALVWRDIASVPRGRILILLALGCFGFSQGIDFVEGIERMSSLPTEALSKALPPWMMIEETLEMVGTALILYVFVAFLARRACGLQFVFIDKGGLSGSTRERAIAAGETPVPFLARSPDDA